MSDIKPISYEYTGFVVSADDKNKFGRNLVLTNALHSESRYPQKLFISSSVKEPEIIPTGLNPGDKVKVVFEPWLIEGISKHSQKAYKVIKLVAKAVTIISRAVINDSEIDEEVPF